MVGLVLRRKRGLEPVSDTAPPESTTRVVAAPEANVGSARGFQSAALRREIVGEMRQLGADPSSVVDAWGERRGA